MQTIRTTRRGAALWLGAALTLSPLVVAAQDQNSAVDANGTPVGMAEEGAAGGPEIVGTDGMIRYGDADEMWEALAGNWGSLGEEAAGRWSDVDPQKLEESGGDRKRLVGLISESYGISEEQAEQEVIAWMTSIDEDT